MPAKQKGLATRGALLEAACDVFARKGYWEATVAEICAAAGANIAALNYHFGDKANAYRKAWRHAFAAGLAAHPLEDAAAAVGSPVERLRAHVTSLLLRMNADGQPTRFERMRIWEITRPSHVIDDVDHAVRDASRRHMLGLLRELIGDGVGLRVLLLCEASILGQCRVVLPFNRPDIELVSRRRINAPMIRALADHIVAFSVAGLRHYARREQSLHRTRTLHGTAAARKRRARRDG
jgi:AcrR family transcriptional regulator